MEKTKKTSPTSGMYVSNDSNIPAVKKSIEKFLFCFVYLFYVYKRIKVRKSGKRLLISCLRSKLLVKPVFTSEMDGLPV